jgi:hypothetical protein
MKHEVFSHYCNGEPKCACCGQSTWKFLILDHQFGISWSGYKNLPRGGPSLLRKLKSLNFPKGFRILCQNCNHSYHFYLGCPHNNKTKFPSLRTQRERDKVFTYYGGKHPKCHFCGEDKWQFLSIDHMDGGGRLDRLKTGHNSYRAIIKCGFPSRLQVLCHNCNLSKGYIGNGSSFQKYFKNLKASLAILKPNLEQARGNKVPHAKLSVSKVHQIRSLIKGGTSQSKIARRMKIGRTQVHRVLNKESWSWVN